MTHASCTAQQICQTGSFELPCSADAAFPLFSPEGERFWIPKSDWNPRPLFPETIEFRRDTIFCTGEGTDQAIWTIVDVDWKRHRAEYVRVSPASHAAHIVVKIEAIGMDRSHVSVEYTVTATADPGHTFLQSFSNAAYAQKMRNWQRQIEDHLRSARN